MIKNQTNLLLLDHDGRTLGLDFEKNLWKDMKSYSSPVGSGQGMVYDIKLDWIIMFGDFGGRSIDGTYFL